MTTQYATPLGYKPPLLPRNRDYQINRREYYYALPRTQRPTLLLRQ